MDGRRSLIVGSIVRAFTENLGLKLMSLLAALAVFGMVRGAGNVPRSIDVALEPRLPPASARRVLLTELSNPPRCSSRGTRSSSDRFPFARRCRGHRRRASA
jgi:hypothetical protein